MEEIIKILRNENFSDEDGDEIIVKEIEKGITYAYVSTEKRGSFSSMLIDENLDYLTFGSATNFSHALEEFRSGRRSNI